MSDNFKSWEDLTGEELVSIAKFIDRYCYGSVTLNMNDTFGYATAWGVDVSIYDIPGLIELDQMFGDDGIVAWAAITEEVESDPIRKHPKFHEAKKYILENKEKYFWSDRYKKEKNNV